MSTGKYNNQNLGKNSNFFSSYRISEFIELFFYLIVAFVFVYFVPVRLNRLLFLIILPIVWYSKRDYFWIAFFFVLLEMPGGLFSGGSKEDPFRLPMYSLAPGFSIAISDLFILVFFAKSLFIKSINRNFSPPFFRKELELLFWLFTGLIVVSTFMGMGMETITKVYKLALSLTLFYSLFHLINSVDQLVKFLQIMFPLALVALALQIYGLINGEQLIALVKPGISAVQGIYNISNKQGELVRPIEMGHAMIITFSGSLWLLFRKPSNMRKPYLVIVNLLSFLVIFLTGTRSWIIAFGLSYLIFLFLAGSKIPRILIRSVVAVVGFLIVINAVPLINKQITNSWSRVATVEKVIEGDITGGGTIIRYDVRGPKVIEGFLSSSIVLGAGFSDQFYNYADGHVGYHNILLNSGIIGCFIFLYAIIKILLKPFIISKKHNTINKPLMKTSIISLIILLIMNTGTQTIGFTPEGINRVILMVYSLMIIDLSVKTNIDKVLRLN